MSREECQQFLDRLNARVAATSAFPLTGRFVIPTEYEWEYACRGGLGNRQPFYFGDRFDGTQANGDGHRPYKGAAGPCLGHTTPVGKYEAVAPHPWGLCDMHGNVWEFCDQIGPAAPRVIRGGCYFSSCGECRSAARNFPAPETVRYMNLGFRVCFRPERPKR